MAENLLFLVVASATSDPSGLEKVRVDRSEHIKVSPGLASTATSEPPSCAAGQVKNQPYGPNPYDMLTFTESGFFMVQINGGHLPYINGSSIQAATEQQLEAVALGTFGISGTYQVDGDGGFKSQHVLGCSFTNWIGITRDTTELTETVSAGGKFMKEHLIQSEAAFVDIV